MNYTVKKYFKGFPLYSLSTYGYFTDQMYPWNGHLQNGGLGHKHNEWRQQNCEYMEEGNGLTESEHDEIKNNISDNEIDCFWVRYT